MISKNETLNLQGIITLSKIHIYSKMMKKKNMSRTWTTINTYYNKATKKLFQNSFI
jgi:hypothetical protein